MKPYKEQHEIYRTTWHWGPLEFDGLFGLYGVFLCFHRHTGENDPSAVVDPAKAIYPLHIPDGRPQPDFLAT